MSFKCPHCKNRVYASYTSTPSDPRTRTPDPRTQYLDRAAIFAEQGPRLLLLFSEDGLGLAYGRRFLGRKEGSMISRSSLYEAYFQWASRFDDPILRRPDFYEMMRGLGFTERRDSTDRFFYGLGEK